ncbi:MAG: restriction endonuclease subunit S [Phycisphaerae bacterium]|nr:restriction endonuclease subunit S [Phycisphaerae bacterium]
MKLIPLNSIFDIKYGNQLDLYKLDSNNESKIAFVSRSSNNLGIVAKVEKINDIEPFPAGLITVTLGGTYVLSSFIQQQPFYTAQNIKVLTPKYMMSYNEKLFYCKAIEMNRFRYTSHGREANETLDTLMVPEEIPICFKNTSFEKAIKVNDRPVLKCEINLDKNSFKLFTLTELFKIAGSKTTSALDLEEYGRGIYPYVTTQATNNGADGFFDYYTEDGEVITFDSAVIGYCAYQPLPFSASDHVEKLIPKFKINKYIAMFLVAVLNQEQYRYSYGRKCSQTRMRKIKIRLPANNGKPDFKFMENYVKSLPYSSSI